jgi:hypothetical protein
MMIMMSVHRGIPEVIMAKRSLAGWVEPTCSCRHAGNVYALQIAINSFDNRVRLIRTGGVANVDEVLLAPIHCLPWTIANFGRIGDSRTAARRAGCCVCRAIICVDDPPVGVGSAACLQLAQARRARDGAGARAAAPESRRGAYIAAPIPRSDRQTAQRCRHRSARGRGLYGASVPLLASRPRLQPRKGSIGMSVPF